MENTKYVAEWTDENEVGVEIHECPACYGVFGVDWTFLDQVSQEIECPMCNTKVLASDPPDQHKPNRGLSNWIYGNIHIDDFNKAIIVVRVRGKEEVIADLENKHAIMLKALETIANRLRNEPHYVQAGMAKVADEAIRKAE